MSEPDARDIEYVRVFLECGLMLDPWLADAASADFGPGLLQRMEAAATGLAARYWRDPTIPALGGAGRPLEGLGARAVRKVLMSTAAVIAHDRAGRLEVTPEVVDEAEARVGAFIGRQGFRALVAMYMTLDRYEDLSALAHYGGMSEDDFLAGRDRPSWEGAPRDAELAHGIADGDLQLVERNGVRFIERTPRGARREEQARRLLTAGGFFEARVRVAMQAELDAMSEYGENLRRMVSAEVEWRRSLTGFIGPQRGARVLELGCGPGTQIFEGGILAAVGAILERAPAADRIIKEPIEMVRGRVPGDWAGIAGTHRSATS